MSKHEDFWKAGREYQFRELTGKNRTGKTLTAIKELVFHLTGDYPDDWVGRTFNNGIAACILSPNFTHSRNIIQNYVEGLLSEWRVEERIKKPGMVDNTLESIYIGNKHGTISRLNFKSAEQPIECFYTGAMDFVLIDEVRGANNIKTKLKYKINSSRGCYVEVYSNPDKYVSALGWDDCDFLSEDIAKQFKEMTR